MDPQDPPLNPPLLSLTKVKAMNCTVFPRPILLSRMLGGGEGRRERGKRRRRRRRKKETLGQVR